MPARTPPRNGWAAPRGPFPQPPARPRPEGLAAVYRRRDPTATPLYPLVQHHLETFLADSAAADPDGGAVPQGVEDDPLYLRCGVLAHGFARIRCDACAAERLIAFSCKGRGVCPSCMPPHGVVASHLTDHVLPPLPLRQWVFSLPKRIRRFLPHDPRLAGDVLRVTPSSAPSPSCTASAPPSIPHFRFHVVVLAASSPRATTATSPSTRRPTSRRRPDRLEHTLQRRVLRVFQRCGLLDEDTVEDMLTWQASGGFSLDASVRIHGSDTAGRERLLRYCARPPFALERLRIARHLEARTQPGLIASGGQAGVRQILYVPARPTRDGRTVLALSPLAFLATLARVIPPPRVTATATIPIPPSDLAVDC